MSIDHEADVLPVAVPVARAGPLKAPTPHEDLLTGLLGPAAWRRIVATESARLVRYRRLATIVLVGVVGLAEMADAWGDAAATEVFLEIGRQLLDIGRESDYLARVGPDRFGMILTETDEISAINFIERARECCQLELAAAGGAARGVRLGFGWASPDAVTTTLADALKVAERRLAADLA